MKSVKDIKQSVRELKVESGEQIHGRILDKLRRSLDKSKEQTAEHQPNIWRTIMKSKIAKLTAVAAIFFAIGLFFVGHDRKEQIESYPKAEAVKSPAELTTFAALTFAYRQGEMKKVEQICDKAIAMAGPRPAGISVHELLEDFNGKVQKGQSYEK